MKTLPASTAVYAEPTEDENRDYAYHLYEQSGRVPGRDLDNWLEARACLKANATWEQAPQEPPAGELFGPDIDARGIASTLKHKKHVM